MGGVDTNSSETSGVNSDTRKLLLGQSGRQVAAMEDLIAELKQLSLSDAMFIGQSCMPTYNLTPVRLTFFAFSVRRFVAGLSLAG